MEKNRVYNVFTPTSPAILTFVERSTINERVVDALRTPGKQLVVYGNSGSGKTTLLVNKLIQLYGHHLTTRCMAGMTIENLLLDAFDQLEHFYKAEYVGKNKKGISTSIQAEYFGIKTKIDAQQSEETEARQQRMLPPQLTPQRLAQFMGEAQSCWVLEDFHKIHSDEKEKLTQLMKMFMDMSIDYEHLKIIAIGSVDSARQIAEYEPEMRNRVAEIHVSLMRDDEMIEILAKGEALLNISIAPDIKESIIEYSNGLASVCHQLALNSCLSLGIYDTSHAKAEIGSDEFKDALERYVQDESDTLKAIFDKAFQKNDECGFIIKALARCDEHDGLTEPDMLDEILKEYPSFREGNLHTYLLKLQTDEYESILRFNQLSGKYDFANPFHKVFARASEDLISEKERKFKGPTVLMDKLKRALSPEMRRASREITDIRTMLENDYICIVNMGDQSLGFLSNKNLFLDEIKSVEIKQGNSEEVLKFKITRPTFADYNATGFHYYYGAKILGRTKVNQEEI